MSQATGFGAAGSIGWVREREQFDRILSYFQIQFVGIACRSKGFLDDFKAQNFDIAVLRLLVVLADNCDVVKAVVFHKPLSVA